MSERTNAPRHPCFKRRVSIDSSITISGTEPNVNGYLSCQNLDRSIFKGMGFKDFTVFVGFKLFQVNLVVDLSRICILVYFEAWYQHILWVDFGAQLALETIGRQRLWHASMQMDGLHPHIYSFLWTFVKSSKYVKIF